MKALFATVLLVLVSGAAHAGDISNYGLACTMSYSSTGIFETESYSSFGWLVSGDTMPGKAVAAQASNIPANTISVKKMGAFWNVTILDSKKAAIGSFSFTEKQGMKATLATDGYMAAETEDPPHYNKLEIACHYTIFAG